MLSVEHTDVLASSMDLRRDCSVLQINRSSARYTSVRPDNDHLRTAMKKVAAERRRLDYRRIHVMLGRQGICMSQKMLRPAVSRREAAKCASVVAVRESWARAGL